MAAGGVTPVIASAGPTNDPAAVRFADRHHGGRRREKGLILRTLEHTQNNKTRAAEILGISLKTLHNKLKEYGDTRR